MIELTLKKSYGEKTVLNINGVTFEEGKRYALIGANGSGKSTLLKIMCGILKADGGSKIEWGGAKDVCYMPQNSQGFSMSLARNVKIAIPDKKRFDFKINHQYNTAAYDIIDKLGLWNLRFKNGAMLSGGETQRMALARTLVVKHDVLLLDEPTAAMDVAAAATAERVVDEFQRRNNCTLIFATHSFNQAKRFADEVLFLHEGLLVERGSASEIFERPQSEELKAFILNA